MSVSMCFPNIPNISGRICVNQHDYIYTYFYVFVLAEPTHLIPNGRTNIPSTSLMMVQLCGISRDTSNPLAIWICTSFLSTPRFAISYLETLWIMTTSSMQSARMIKWILRSLLTIRNSGIIILHNVLHGIYCWYCYITTYIIKSPFYNACNNTV